MPPSLRTVLLGPSGHRFQRRLNILFATALFFTMFLAYAVGVFEVSGGVVFFPVDAAVVGTVAAASIGYQQSGLVFGWLAAYAPLLAFSADHYLLGLSSRPIPDRVVAFLQPDGLAFLAVEAVIVGTVAWAIGHVVGGVVLALRASSG